MEHIVQIAFDFDDERVRQTIENTVKKEVIDGIQADIVRALLHNFGSWNSNREGALVDLMRERTDNFLKENKDVILEAAAKNLSERLAKSKKGKELLEGLEKEV